MNHASHVDPSAEGPASSPAVPPRPLPDFSDTETTFSHLSNGELKWAGRLFSLMGKSWLSDPLASLGSWAVRWRLPFAQWGVRSTIYRQFVGGTSLENALPTIARLHTRDVTSIMDYGAEAKSSEADFDRFRDEILKAIRLSSSNDAVDSVVIKVTGLAPNDLLEKHNRERIDFNAVEDPSFERVIQRLVDVCEASSASGIEVYIDAEETWFLYVNESLDDVGW